MELANKKAFNREDLVDMVSGELKSKYKGTLSEDAIDDVIFKFMDLTASIIRQGGSVTLRPWGKFVQKTRKARPYKAPTGEWVSKPGKLVMGFKPFRAGKEEMPGTAE